MDTNQINVSTPDQMKTMIREVVAECMQSFFNKLKDSSFPSLPEKLTKDQALGFMADNGFPTTSGNLYKMTANSEIPCARIGKRLIFSKTSLLNWIECRSISKTESLEKTARLVSKSANNHLGHKRN